MCSFGHGQEQWGQGSVDQAAGVSAASLWCVSPIGGTRGQHATVEIARTSEHRFSCSMHLSSWNLSMSHLKMGFM